VTSEARWVEVVAEIEKRFGRLDILVSNAGIGLSVPSIVEMSLEDWRRQTAINLDGVFAQERRRVDHPDVVARGTARLGQPCRI
jgi:NAD(P)-dependent dehydrogenase (short-subunit alcohol dehydrogenase family)